MDGDQCCLKLVSLCIGSGTYLGQLWYGLGSIASCARLRAALYELQSDLQSVIALPSLEALRRGYSASPGQLTLVSDLEQFNGNYHVS